MLLLTITEVKLPTILTSVGSIFDRHLCFARSPNVAISPHFSLEAWLRLLAKARMQPGARKLNDWLTIFPVEIFWNKIPLLFPLFFTFHSFREVGLICYILVIKPKRKHMNVVIHRLGSFYCSTSRQSYFVSEYAVYPASNHTKNSSNSYWRCHNHNLPSKLWCNDVERSRLLFIPTQLM